MRLAFASNRSALMNAVNRSAIRAGMWLGTEAEQKDCTQSAALALKVWRVLILSTFFIHVEFSALEILNFLSAIFESGLSSVNNAAVCKNMGSMLAMASEARAPFGEMFRAT